MQKTIFNSTQVSKLLEIIQEASPNVYLKYKNLEVRNRVIKEMHVKKLMESFSMYGTAAARVIVVKTKAVTGRTEYYVADGQHSIKAASRLKLNLTVMVVELYEDTMINLVKYIALLNNNSKSWSNKNYNNSFYDIPEYKIFADIMANTGLKVTDLLFIFLGCSQKQHKVFKSGDMKFADVNDSMLMLDATLVAMPYIPNKSFARRSLYRIFRLCKDYGRMAQAIVKTAEYLKLAQSKFSENETEFYSHLTEIYRAEFKIK